MPCCAELCTGGSILRLQLSHVTSCRAGTALCGSDIDPKQQGCGCRSRHEQPVKDRHPASQALAAAPAPSGAHGAHQLPEPPSGHGATAPVAHSGVAGTQSSCSAGWVQHTLSFCFEQHEVVNCKMCLLPDWWLLCTSLLQDQLVTADSFLK